MNIEAFYNIKEKVESSGATLVAVSKTKPIEDLQKVFDEGQRIFGENRAYELADKAQKLSTDFKWHMIGHLQRNKVKEVVSFTSLLHSADSIRLIKQVDKDANAIDKVIPILLQLKIAAEESKYGFEINELYEWLDQSPFEDLKNIEVHGVMGMATFTDDKVQVRKEFKKLRSHFDHLKANYFKDKEAFSEVSMGMSGDYEIALEEGSTMVRVGSSIFGSRETP